MTRSLALAVALALLALSTPAAAQENDQQLDEAARLTFESAREAFVAGDYENALARFRQAYQLSQRPGLLYNIAQTLDRLRRDEETLQALRDYLAAQPDAANRSEVEARIRVLERSIADRPVVTTTTTSDGTTTTTVTRAPRDPLAIVHPAVFIALGGVALASGAVTIWAGLETLSLNDEYLAESDAGNAEMLYEDASTMQLLTNVFIGTTAAFGVAAVALAIITDWNAFGGSGDSAGVSIAPRFAFGPDGASLGLGGTF